MTWTASASAVELGWVGPVGNAATTGERYPRLNAMVVHLAYAAMRTQEPLWAVLRA